MTPETPTPEEQPEETIVELFGKRFIKTTTPNGRIELHEIASEE